MERPPTGDRIAGVTRGRRRLLAGFAVLALGSGLFLLLPGRIPVPGTEPPGAGGEDGAPSPWPGDDRWAMRGGDRFVLSVYDLAARAGERVALQAKLEKVKLPPLLDLDVKGETLSFRLDGEPAGEAVTAREGIASVGVAAPPPGPHNIEVSWGNGRAWGTLLVVAAGDPALVTDVDHTISDFPEPEVPVTPVEKMPPLPDAPAVLTRLHERYWILYVTARDDAFLQKTKAWLKFHGFPRGPVFCRDFRLLGPSAPSYKAEVLRRLKPTIPNIRFGMSEKGVDARVYREAGIRPLVLKSVRDDTLPPEALRVNGWNGVEEAIREEEGRAGKKEPGKP